MGRQAVQLAQRPFHLARQDGARQFQKLRLGRQTEHREDIRLLDFVPAKADELVERGFGVAHRALSAARNCVKSGIVNGHLFLSGDVLQMFGNQRRRDAPQVEALAARHNRWQDLLRVGRGEHEFHMFGRLFQGLEQRVERRGREHVDFVNDVNLETRAGRRVAAGLAQFAHLLDAIVAGAVNLKHVQRTPLGDFPAARIVIVEVHFGPVGAIEAFGEDAGDGGLAGPARAAKEVGMGNPLLLDRVGQGLRDMLLPHDVLEALRTILSRYDLICHL